MTQHYMMVATGTAATLLATALLLFRVKLHGHRPAVALVRRWIAVSFPSSGLVLLPLAAIAALCFAGVAQNELSSSSAGASLSDTPSAPHSAFASDDDSNALESLRAYANSIDAHPEMGAAQSPASNAVDLPDVDTMIVKLVTRLEKDPNDVNGWKMLGWSYLNTDKPDDAAKAYETALKLDPGNVEIKKALEQIKSAHVAASNSPSASTSEPATGDTASQRNDMIHGMVDNLAARLEASPNDENGWMRLMSSRMTLGEKDAAKAALTKALAAFANDAAAKTRLTSAARELGIDAE
ncbi:tetratricopeptide repeat protein [Hyphomicrobium facile]|uniref:Cytochrome c-type biogenesis protein CcmH n=1 Tax=Hyphomicrobium facile TaxID=51670 RepID=A0A1I7NVS7_9HYPH|nr:tetratricopeptide repeat protein [Hyphomicrobium facile]SFV38775.1 cytochrome c-type biogenesis protein CcmH [Hyphomicrobium facile]